MAQVIGEPLLQHVCRVSRQIPSSPPRGLTSRFIRFELDRSMMIAVLILMVNCIVAIGRRTGRPRMDVSRLLVLRVWCLMMAGSSIAVVHAAVIPIPVIAIAVIPIARSPVVNSTVTWIPVVEISARRIWGRRGVMMRMLMIRRRRWRHPV